MYKSELQTWTQKNKVDLPAYITREEDGWVSVVRVNNQIFTHHQKDGKKKSAENEVARIALHGLHEKSKVMVMIPPQSPRVCIIFDMITCQKVCLDFFENVTCANIDIIALDHLGGILPCGTEYVEYQQISNLNLFIHILAIECARLCCIVKGLGKIVIVSNRKKVDLVIETLQDKFPHIKFLKSGVSHSDIVSDCL